MELTKEQIQRVNKYLDSKGIKFIDFRIEIFDHIVSQIEQKLEAKNLNFETTFQQVTDNWNIQLNKTTSFIFGLMYPAPKVVINKAKRIFKTYLILCCLPIVISFLIVFNTKMELNKMYGYFIISALIILLCVSLFFTYKISKSKEKTVFNFIIKTQLLNFIFLPLVLIGTSINDFINLGLLGYMLVVTYYLVSFYKKHQKEKEKYKLLVK